MANEEKQDFHATLHRDSGRPRTRRITDEAMIRKYGGDRFHFAPPLACDTRMKAVPSGKGATAGVLRAHPAEQAQAACTDPMTAGIFPGPASSAAGQERYVKDCEDKLAAL